MIVSGFAGLSCLIALLPLQFVHADNVQPKFEDEEM